MLRMPGSSLKVSVAARERCRPVVEQLVLYARWWVSIRSKRQATRATPAVAGTVEMRKAGRGRGLLPDPNNCVVSRSSEHDPCSVVPVAPMIQAGVPNGVSPRGPRRRRWRRWRPRRWRSPAGPAVVVVPVMAVVPVPVVAPTLVPLVARAPVVVVSGCGSGRRLSRAGGQSKGGHGHATGRKHTSAQAKPRFGLRVCTHARPIPGENRLNPRNRFVSNSDPPHSGHLCTAYVARCGRCCRPAAIGPSAATKPWQ